MDRTMNLDNIELPTDCRVKYIEKMYYQKYIYKLRFEIDRSQLVRSKHSGRYYSWVEYANKRSLINQLSKSINNQLKDYDYKIRTESFGLGVFTSDSNVVASLITNPPGKLLELIRPLNDKHIDIIDNHRKVVVRKTLFNKEFKFKVYLKYNQEMVENRYLPFKEFLSESVQQWSVNKELVRLFSDDMRKFRYGYTRAVYLNSSEDLMMFQLKFNDYISKVEEVILLSDL